MKQIIVLLFSGLFITPAIAENPAKEYKITKEWNVDANTAFELAAKYQNIQVETWDKDVVRFDFVLTTTSDKINEADFKDALKIKAEKTGNTFSVSASIDNINSSTIWDWIFNDKKNKEKYKLNTTIYLPKKIASVDFNVNYCILNFDELNIPAKITSNYGKLNIVKNNNRIVISSTYTDINLGNVRYLKVNSKYSDFILNDIDTLYMQSNYGDIKINSCPLIESLTMNYGKINVQNAGSIKVTSTYSDIIINSLLQYGNATLTYSDLKVNEIAKSISGISIATTYSDCKLKINPDNPVNFNFNGANSDVSINNQQLIVTKKSEVSNVSSITAKTKSATDASPVIKISGSNSDVLIN